MTYCIILRSFCLINVYVLTCFRIHLLRFKKRILEFYGRKFIVWKICMILPLGTFNIIQSRWFGSKYLNFDSIHTCNSFWRKHLNPNNAGINLNALCTSSFPNDSLIYSNTFDSKKNQICSTKLMLPAWINNYCDDHFLIDLITKYTTQNRDKMRLNLYTRGI